jgi:hypothetical protein
LRVSLYLEDVKSAVAQWLFLLLHSTTFRNFAMARRFTFGDERNEFWERASLNLPLLCNQKRENSTSARERTRAHSLGENNFTN